ncbi:MAG TPA: hypothetical protein VLA89_17365 [Gemmatimonadales bacterium]|nr:hypothetical protein [Gemmatimonadales bacterium]
MTWYQSVRDSRVFVTNDPEDIEEMRSAIEADWEACGHPGSRGMPDHNTGSVIDNDRLYQGYTYQCRSGSRWFNPKTRQMEGRKHCTCDGCF